MKRLFHFIILLALSLAVYTPAFAADTPDPTMVGIPGTHQDELGCPSDWLPGCEQTLLKYDPEDGVWQGEFEIQPANDGDKKGSRYKAALNGAWDENYGLNATRGGTDIPLAVDAPRLVKFYYDHETHWIVDNYNTQIFVVAGDFQQQLTCSQNFDPTCLRSWLKDPDGDGVFSFTTKALKAGTYNYVLAINEDPKTDISQTATFTVKADGAEIYFGYDSLNKVLTVSSEGAPRGSLAKLKAHWVSLDTILWNTTGSPRYTYSLFYSPAADLKLTASGVENGVEIPLTYQKSGAEAGIIRKFPNLGAYTALKLTNPNPGQLREALKSQLAVIVRDQNGKVVDVTGVQIPGVLDQLYPYSGELGLTWDGSTPTLRVWAPTAISVTLDLFSAPDAAQPERLAMTWDPATGVWSLVGKPEWKNLFFLYEIQVYVPSTGKLETNLVTDPYSLSLSMNSKRSQIVDLRDPALIPSKWAETTKPALAAPEDIVIYELHIRDFSISDESVPAEQRGTYLAFTQADANGMSHLRALAKAGLTHIHLLPAFDIASVNEDRSTWQTTDPTLLAAMPPDGDGQPTAVSAINGVDGFNWGYDPLHYTVPEGSYSTAPDGSQRILEFRQMVQSINQAGLRVVMDVVYNHTNASGQSENSVLDRVVPGYYHRLNAEGKVEKSTCCENTATEHDMMRKLMVDSVVTWAREYKVDGFRFDLMGHHMLADMQAVRAALDALTLEKDGVDGKSIYIYGEGWNFGEVANGARGVNATQSNIGGTGIGVFNDRLRDGLRGGSPFDDPRVQGFSTGLFLTPNENEKRPLEDQKTKLLDITAWIRLGMAGNLAEFPIQRANGDIVPGRLLLYNGAGAGYTLDPQENIVYTSAHDNETLWDAVAVKSPASASLEQRVRMNDLALSVVTFSQGVPFFHAGDDILRSKSLDRNSYNSGDWFNRIDWTYASNNFGVGLPVEGRDRADIYRPLLANPALKPGKTEINTSAAIFRELLQIRKSSPLFRLQTAAQVGNSLSFLNTGPDQTPGLIVMRLQDVDQLDPVYDGIVVLINAHPEAVRFGAKEFVGTKYSLHPVQQNSADTIVRDAAFNEQKGEFSVPAYTAAVFVLEDPAGVQPMTMLLALIGGLVMLFLIWRLFFSRKEK